jgi:hypothetical protein
MIPAHRIWEKEIEKCIEPLICPANCALHAQSDSFGSRLSGESCFAPTIIAQEGFKAYMKKYWRMEYLSLNTAPA